MTLKIILNAKGALKFKSLKVIIHKLLCLLLQVDLKTING